MVQPTADLRPVCLVARERECRDTGGDTMGSELLELVATASGPATGAGAQGRPPNAERGARSAEQRWKQAQARSRRQTLFRVRHPQAGPRSALRVPVARLRGVRR